MSTTQAQKPATPVRAQKIAKQVRDNETSSDKTIKVVCYTLCVMHVLFIGILSRLPVGTFMPSPLLEIHAVTMLLMCLVHGIYCFGAVQSLAFFITAMIIEWTYEQVNISSGGWIFGSVFYDDQLLGPKLMDVPIFVPVGIYFMCWPSYVIGNMIMHQKVVVMHEPTETKLQLIWRCAIYSFIHTAWSLAIDPACLKFGFYTYTGVEIMGGPIPMSDTYFGVPVSEFRGWSMMIFTQWFVFLGFVSHFFYVPVHEESFRKKIERLEAFHLTPVILYGGFTVFLIINPLNKALGAVTCWVMGMPVLFALYQWYSFQQAQKLKNNIKSGTANNNNTVSKKVKKDA